MKYKLKLCTFYYGCCHAHNIFTNACTLTHIPTDLMTAWTTFCLYENLGFDITSPDVEFSLSMA